MTVASLVAPFRNWKAVAVLLIVGAYAGHYLREHPRGGFEGARCERSSECTRACEYGHAVCRAGYRHSPHRFCMCRTREEAAIHYKPAPGCSGMRIVADDGDAVSYVCEGGIADAGANDSGGQGGPSP